MPASAVRVGLAIGFAGAVALAQTAPQSSGQRPTFRTRTTLRTVEVRVIDSKFRPVTGLTQEDFTLEEDKKPQEIRAFATIDLQPEPGVTPAARSVTTMPGGMAVSNRRVFVIVIGRGSFANPNHQNPSKGLDGLIHLVRNLLLPQDEVAVLVWNRATDFTTDHERIARMLEQYKAKAKNVESLLDQQFQGLAAIYGNREIPEYLNREITAILSGAGTPAIKTMLPAATSMAAIQQGIQSNTALLQEVEARGARSLDPFAAGRAETIGMSLDQYASATAGTLQDLTRIYAGLAYLRYLDGEKHMIYLSDKGLIMPSADDDRSLARVAQDAGVHLNVFHSCGVCARAWEIATSENITEFTGGQFTGLTYGTKFFERVDAATRTGYQLGYSPSNPELDGAYRRVTVKVKGRGLTVLYSRGYFASDDPATLDRRQVISQTRIDAAMSYPEDVPDIALTGAAVSRKRQDGKLEMIVLLVVTPSTVTVSGEGQNRSVSLDVAIACFDHHWDKTYIVGQTWHPVKVDLADEARYQQFLKTGVSFTVHVPIRRSANVVRGAVYDYLADRVGTITPKIK